MNISVQTPLQDSVFNSYGCIPRSGIAGSHGSFHFLRNLHTDFYRTVPFYIMRDAGLEEAQAGIKIAGRNINNLRYAHDTTLMAESEELKSLLMKVKEESEKAGLKLNSFRKLRSWHPVPSLHGK